MDSTGVTRPNSKEHRRSKTGCQTCRSKRKKCDETRPRCQRCARTGSTCHWPSSVRFRYENIPGPAKTPPVRAQTDGRATGPVPERLAATSANVQGVPGAASPSIHHSLDDQDENNEDITPEINTCHPFTQRSAKGSLSISVLPASGLTYSPTAWMSNGALHGQTIRNTANQHGSGIDIQFPHSRGHEVYISPQSVSNIDHGCSPDVLTDDGIFLPGSTYQELHQALRSQIFQTTQSQPNSRQPSVQPPTAALDANIEQRTSPGPQEDRQGTPSTGSSTPPDLTTGQEVVLWNNWINEIGPWLDKFDHQQHHRHTLPGMAQSIPHLKYSMLALSARQLERKNGSLPHATSLSLYQWAIHLLLPVLHTKSIPVLASCVILCVFEMSSCSPKAWRRHLDGCASLIMDMDIRGDQGGLEQSLFWCFARMDVCGGLISSEPPLIPIEKWYLTGNLGRGGIPIPGMLSFEDHASFACYLLARVVSLLNPPRSSRFASRRMANDEHAFVADWVRLFDELSEWHRNLPAEMRPVLSIASSLDDNTNPFPTVVYSSGAAISGNQLYHTSVLLMLQKKPRGITVESRSILWHARQICAISMSNSHHGAWTNSVQPLWIAGKLMSHPSEHRAIVELYQRIEKETGWGATWRAADLQQHWGDLT